MTQPLEALSSIAQIQERVMACQQCPRLVAYLQQVAAKRKMQFLVQSEEAPEER